LLIFEKIIFASASVMKLNASSVITACVNLVMYE